MHGGEAVLTELISSIAGAGATGAVGTVYSVIASRFRAARNKAEKYETLADQQDKLIENLRDQIRDLKTVALIRSELGNAQSKGPKDNG